MTHDHKIPFNTTCHSVASKQQLPSFPQYIKAPPPVAAAHIKAPLPPTLTGFPGVASIRYYVKATVNRKEFYKENPRQIHHISFLPIEPPRPPNSGTENYGRRTYQFPDQNAPGKSSGPSLRKVMAGLKFGSRSNTGLSTSSEKGHLPSESPRIELDARLPDPAILTAGQPIPLRVLIKRLDGGTDPVYLQMLAVELAGHTSLRAGAYTRSETSTWVVSSRANMSQELHFPESKTAAASEKQPVTSKPRPLTLAATLWSTPLPASVAPSFRTCNIARNYDLDVRVGLSLGPEARNSPPVILPLRLKCDVYSGISPPAPLLAAVAEGKGRPVNKKPLSAAARANAAAAASASSAQAAHPPGKTAVDVAPEPSSPITPLRHDTETLQDDDDDYDSGMPGSSSVAPGPVSAGGVVMDDDALPPPPSYEDAMAQDLEPTSGPRVYEPGPAPAGDEGFPADRKRRGS